MIVGVPREMLFTYLHLAANRTLTEALVQCGVTALAYETFEVNGRLPLLEPMSEIITSRTLRLPARTA